MYKYHSLISFVGAIIAIVLGHSMIILIITIGPEGWCLFSLAPFANETHENYDPTAGNSRL